MTEASEQPGKMERARRSLLGVLAIVLLALPGIAVRYALHDGLDAFHFLFSLFFSINLRDLLLGDLPVPPPRPDRATRGVLE